MLLNQVSHLVVNGSTTFTTIYLSSTKQVVCTMFAKTPVAKIQTLKEGSDVDAFTVVVTR